MLQLTHTPHHHVIAMNGLSITGWVLLHSNSRIASLIKIDTQDENNIEALKAFLKNGNFKAKLKW